MKKLEPEEEGKFPKGFGKHKRKGKGKRKKGKGRK